jgi:uncharacterized protein
LIVPYVGTTESRHGECSFGTLPISATSRSTTSPEEAEQVIANDPIDVGERLRNGETRFVQVGETATGRILIVVSTLRQDLIRGVTAHPANRAQRRFYAAHKDIENAQDRGDI